MATLPTTAMTLMDLAKSMDPDGTVARIIEMLEKKNEILKDMPFKMGNLTTGHRAAIRTGLAAATWTLFNQGVQPSKGSRAQIDFQCGNLKSWSIVDKDLADLAPDLGGFRLSEAGAHLQAMTNEAAETLFYGSPLAPQEFIGLSSYYDDTTAGNGAHVIPAGGAGSDNSSIWMISWGEDLCGLFPRGTEAGLKHEDKGLQTLQSAGGVAGALLDVLMDKWAWNFGLLVGDWKNAVRICNIDISNLVGESSAADLRKHLIKAYHRIPNKKNCRIYMNRTCAEFLDIQGRDDAILSGCLGEMTLDGEEVMTFRRIPIRVCDALLETESTVS